MRSKSFVPVWTITAATITLTSSSVLAQLAPTPATGQRPTQMLEAVQVKPTYRITTKVIPTLAAARALQSAQLKGDEEGATRQQLIVTEDVTGRLHGDTEAARTALASSRCMKEFNGKIADLFHDEKAHEHANYLASMFGAQIEVEFQFSDQGAPKYLQGIEGARVLSKDARGRTTRFAIHDDEWDASELFRVYLNVDYEAAPQVQKGTSAGAPVTVLRGRTQIPIPLTVTADDLTDGKEAGRGGLQAIAASEKCEIQLKNVAEALGRMRAQVTKEYEAVDERLIADIQWKNWFEANKDHIVAVMTARRLERERREAEVAQLNAERRKRHAEFSIAYDRDRKAEIDALKARKKASSQTAR